MSERPDNTATDQGPPGASPEGDSPAGAIPTASMSAGAATDPAALLDLGPLEEIVRLPVRDHLAMYEQIHVSLRAALVDVER